MAISALALPQDGSSPDTSYTAEEWRQSLGAYFAHTSNPISCIPGVVAGLAVTGLAGPSAQVAPGCCVITPTDGLRGSYLWFSNAAETVALAPADTTYSRLDAVVARVRDKSYADSASDATVGAVTGTPSAVPVAPPIPDGTLLLALVTVPPSGTPAANNNIKLWTSSIGGSMVGTAAQRAALATTHLRPGQEFTQTDPAAPGKWRWSGSAWLPTFPQSSIWLLGETQRDVNFDHKFVITAGKLFAFPIRKPTGSPWTEQNTLATTSTSGFNWVAPYAGSYRIAARTMAPAGENGRFTLSIWKNLNATTIDQGSIGAPKPGATLLRESWTWIGGSSGSNPRPVPLSTEIASIRLNAGDTITVTVWHPETSSRDVYWENPHTSCLEITRWSD